MNEFVPMNNLIREAFSFKKYKALPLPLAIIIGIFLLPVWATAFSFAALFYVAAAILAICDFPVETLLAFVRREAKEVNEITQVFVYFFGWPLILFFKVFAILCKIFNYVVYFVATVFFFIASLCGVEFDFKMEKNERNLVAEEKNKPAMVKGIILVVLFALTVYWALLFGLFMILSLVRVPVIIALIFLYVAAGFYTLAILWIVVAFGTRWLNGLFKERPHKEKKAKPAKEHKHEEEKEEVKVEEAAPEEAPVEEVKVEETAPEEAPVEEVPAEEEHHEEAPEHEHKEHFDYSSEYDQNRHPAEDYQAERLDDLEDDYDRR